jgi:hypothetical protein
LNGHIYVRGLHTFRFGLFGSKKRNAEPHLYNVTIALQEIGADPTEHAPVTCDTCFESIGGDPSERCLVYFKDPIRMKKNVSYLASVSWMHEVSIIYF